MNKPFTDTDFYNHLYKAVKGYPTQESKCLQPQTFAVLFDTSVLNTPNLSKTVADAKKRMFYSRKWDAKGKTKKIEYEYPALLVFPLEKQISEVFGVCTNLRQKFGFLLVDQHKEECKTKKCNYCGDRNIMEIERDTCNMLLNILQYFRGLKLVNYEIAGEYFSDYFHENEISCLQDYWDSFNTMSCNNLIGKMKRENHETEFQPWYGGIDNLYGTQTHIELCWQVDKEQIEFEFCKPEKPMQPDCC